LGATPTEHWGGLSTPDWPSGSLGQKWVASHPSLFFKFLIVVAL